MNTLLKVATLSALALMVAAPVVAQNRITGIEALNDDPYPELVIDEDGVRETIVETVSSSHHFAWVSENNGIVEGSLMALCNPMLCYKRKDVIITKWRCKNGEGMKLFAEFMRWVMARPIIRQVQYFSERGHDDRIMSIIKRRYGFRTDIRMGYFLK